jgi:hypothetical protein
MEFREIHSIDRGIESKDIGKYPHCVLQILHHDTHVTHFYEHANLLSG